ncbi:MAG: ABC transporter permease, partial [Dehalococcoidia bacterium]
ITNRSIGRDVKERLPVTLEFLVLVMLMQVPLGVGLGVLSAVFQNTVLDYGIRFTSILLLAIPSFWLATLVIILPSVWWSWSLPIGYSDLWDNPTRNLYQLSVPASIAAISSAAVLMRVTRSQMLEVMRSDYVRTARAKGLSPRVVILRHTLHNALVPVITVIGLTVAVGVGGAVIMEQVFSIPGIGSYTASSLVSRDYPAIQAVTLLIGLSLCVVNLVVDLSYGLVDPRIRFK